MPCPTMGSRSRTISPPTAFSNSISQTLPLPSTSSSCPKIPPTATLPALVSCWRCSAKLARSKMLHNRSTHSLKFSAALVLLTALSFCQAPEPQSLPRFTSGTNYVEVPVIVQRSGKHVAGLSKDAFTLKQDGKAVPIATFQEVHHDAATTTASAAPGSAVPEQVVPPQITIIALDMV